MLAALVVGRRAESAGGGRFKGDTFDVTVKGEIKIEPRLLAVGDDIQTGGGLIVNRRDNRIVDPAEADFDPEPLDQPPLAIDWDALEQRRYAPFFSPPPNPRLWAA